MGRRSHASALNVWMNGELVGLWRVRPSAEPEFRYAASWLSSDSARPLSLSLPLLPETQAHRGSSVTFFFDNLLPDNAEIRARIQSRFGTDSTNAFDLLAAVGRDCVGAVQLLPEGDVPTALHQVEGDTLTDAEVEQALLHTVGPRFGRGDDVEFRISLAGAQEKTAFLRHQERWKRPRHTTPTTHIFKLPMGQSPTLDLSTSVENEWLCHQVLRCLEVPVAHCEMAHFGSQRVLVVERFDRRWSPDGSRLLRLPQEDMCQATATSSGKKYESDGGPGIRQILALLLGSQQAEVDRRDFLRTQLVFWLLCAPDGHAKNFSLALGPGGSYRLTPRYDVLSAFPVLGKGKGRLAERQLKMAMAVWGKNRHFRWREIRREHWRETARACGVPGVDDCIEELVARTPEVIERVGKLLPPGFPSDVAESILGGLARAARLLSAGS